MSCKVRELRRDEVMPAAWAPVQSSDRGAVEMEIAEAAYIEYVKRYGSLQSLPRLCERGGFCWAELVEFLYARLTASIPHDAGKGKPCG